VSAAGETRFGSFRLDRRARRLWSGSEEVLLTPKAMEVLLFLLDRAGTVVKREELLEALWPETYVDDHALSVQIREIRKALGDQPGKPKYIETRHRRGYLFIGEVLREASEPAAQPSEARPERSLYTGPIPETRYAQSGSVNIAYQVAGDGPIDLVFVMGWVSHLEYFWREPSFERFLRRLASFSRLILFDKRGTGLSDRIPIPELPTLELRMDDLRAVMEAAGSKRAAICGVSEGGPMSALFAATYPDQTSALVMIGTYAKRIHDADYPWAPTAEQREKFLEEIQNHWGGPVGLEERAPSMAGDAAFREWWATYLRMGASPGAAVALTRMNAEIDVRQALGSIRVPALVIHRTGDRCLKVEEGRYVASRIPGAEFLELDGTDHLPFVGDQDAILDAIESFLTGVKRGGEPERVLATVLCIDGSEGWAELREEVRREVEWFRGRPFLADASCVAMFDGPARAVRCAASVAKHSAEQGVTIRAALHTGEVETGRNPAGLTVEVTRAILAAAEPGSIVASSTVRDLVAGSGLKFRPAGKLVGASVPEFRLFAVETES
jgi:pimeloyl-ACP methyl ester carboxylesterase/DNA-binding winged helix-turn-helix (wHTH) protein